MKNKLFKTCFTGLALSVAGLAHAQQAPVSVKIFTETLMSHAAISGAALSIAAGSVVTGNLAAQAAVSIGADINDGLEASLSSSTGATATGYQIIYAGAAVNTGAGSAVGDIFSGAATGIGASAHAGNIHAGAAIAIGAGATVHHLVAGGAITAQAEPMDELDADANHSQIDGRIRNTVDMALAIDQIKVAQRALFTLNANGNELYVGTNEFVAPGIYSGAALTIAAGSHVTFGAESTGAPTDHVWVINLSGALTVGAGSQFFIDIPADDTATIIWNVGAAVTLGAGTQFVGTVFANGAFNAATSDVSCGNIYATGAVSVGGITRPVTLHSPSSDQDHFANGGNCVSSSHIADFSVTDGHLSSSPVEVAPNITGCYSLDDFHRNSKLQTLIRSSLRRDISETLLYDDGGFEGSKTLRPNEDGLLVCPVPRSAAVIISNVGTSVVHDDIEVRAVFDVYHNDKGDAVMRIFGTSQPH
jgi:hypothetical protein